MPPSSVKAQQNEKMVEVRIRFWTNDIASKTDHVVPKHAWSSGVVLMKRNGTHGIAPKNPVPFNSLAHLPSVIERVLVAHDIKLHTSDNERKYRA